MQKFVIYLWFVNEHECMEKINKALIYCITLIMVLLIIFKEKFVVFYIFYLIEKQNFIIITTTKMFYQKTKS
jgi:hypothetical protein